MLLGKERESGSWPAGSNRWSGFSGRVDPAERTALGAAREFLEESLHSVRLGCRGREAPAADDQERGPEYESLEGVEEVLRRALTLENVIQGRMEIQKHITYLVPVAFLDYPGIFQSCRQELLGMNRVVARFANARRLCLRRLSNLFVPGRALTSELHVRDLRMLSDCEVEVELWNSTDFAKSYHVFILTPDVMREFKRFNSSWRAMLRFMEEKRGGGICDHPAVQSIRMDGMLCSARIDKANLEKSELRWWPLAELKAVIRNKAQYRGIFRHCFLEFLDGLVSAIEQPLSV